MLILSRNLSEEQQRHVCENNMTEEEFELSLNYDIEYCLGRDTEASEN